MPLNPKKKEAFDQFLGTLQKTMPADKFEALKAAYLNPDGSYIEEAVDNTAQHVMLRKDYFESNAELNRQRAQLQQEQEALTADLAQLAQYETQINEYETYLKSNAVNRTDWESAQAELATLRGWRDAAQARVAELGVDGLLEGITPPPTSISGRAKQNGAPMPQPTPTADPKSPIKYVTDAQLTQRINENALAPVMLDAQRADIVNEYFALTGKNLPNQAKFIADAIASGKPLLDYAEEVLGLKQLRADKAKSDYEAEMQRRVQAEVSKITSEGRLPTGQAPRDYQHSPFIQQMMNGMSPGAGNENDVLSGKPQNRPGEAARRATEAHYAGTYSGQRM